MKQFVEDKRKKLIAVLSHRHILAQLFSNVGDGCHGQGFETFLTSAFETGQISSSANWEDQEVQLTSAHSYLKKKAKKPKTTTKNHNKNKNKTKSNSCNFWYVLDQNLAGFQYRFLCRNPGRSVAYLPICDSTPAAPTHTLTHTHNPRSLPFPNIFQVQTRPSVQRSDGKGTRQNERKRN